MCIESIGPHFRRGKYRGETVHKEPFAAIDRPGTIDLHSGPIGGAYSLPFLLARLGVVDADASSPHAALVSIGRRTDGQACAISALCTLHSEPVLRTLCPVSVLCALRSVPCLCALCFERSTPHAAPYLLHFVLCTLYPVLHALCLVSVLCTWCCVSCSPCSVPCLCALYCAFCILYSLTNKRSQFVSWPLPLSDCLKLNQFCARI